LKTVPLDFGFPLRPYQQRAIGEVEKALEADRRRMLLAMATGTGKTKLAIALLYRLLAANRFRRICFVVDRNALGQQAEAEFRSTKVVSVKTFADIFGLKGLNDIAPESETKVHICTIQGLVKRVLFAEDNAEAPSIIAGRRTFSKPARSGWLATRRGPRPRTRSRTFAVRRQL
jgi:type I restriction enzyme R subunit